MITLARLGKLSRLGHAFSGQIAGAVGALVQLKLLAGALGPGQFGTMALVLGAVALASAVLVVPWMQAILRIHVLDHSPSRRTLLAPVLAGTACVAVAAAVGGAFEVSWLASPGLFTATLLLFVAEAARAVWLTRLNLHMRLEAMAAFQWGDAGLRSLAAAAVFLAPAVSSAGALLLVAAAGLVAVMAHFVWLVRLSPGGLVPSLMTNSGAALRLRGDLLRFAAPLVPVAALSWLSSVGDRYVIAHYFGSASVGAYAAQYGILSRPFVALAQGLETAFRQPVYVAYVGARRREWRTQVFHWVGTTLLLGGLGAAVLAFLGEPFIRWFLGAEFIVPGPFVALLVSAQALYAGGYTVLRAAMSAGASSSAFWAELVSASIAIVAALVLVPGFGLVGAAVATMCAYSAYLCIGTFALIAADRSLVEEKR